MGGLALELGVSLKYRLDYHSVPRLSSAVLRILEMSLQIGGDKARKPVSISKPYIARASARCAFVQASSHLFKKPE